MKLVVLSVSILLLTRLLAPAAAEVPVRKAGKEVVNVSASPHVTFRAIGLDEARWTGGFWGDRWELNRRVPAARADRILLRLIPYYAWCNRGASQMTVWLPAL